MKAKTKKMMFLGALGALLVAVSVGVYLYQKGPLDVRSARGIPVEAEALYRAYVTDSSAARNLYDTKVLAVSGVVESVSHNAQQEQVVLLQAGGNGFFINCSMDETVSLKGGDRVVLKGICSGQGEGDAEMGIPGDVYLGRVILSN
ncbi:MAG TPA: hypothetical protein PLE75_08110 [Ferruginibacter sp.]|nr:hypothetical protein [Ferruginibacter sp.]HRO06634.1 hypothetical protein [Ferruginibacter sp.]HRO96844.1 hypothetical protein [Ferruginibacter sp.]HRP50041.1 hypothetical protein [Ferruginibacter sp.]